MENQKCASLGFVTLLMLSTVHDDTMVGKSRRSRTVSGGVETIQKPKLVEDYNLHMGGVDKSKSVIEKHVYNTLCINKQPKYRCTEVTKVIFMN